MTLWQADCVVHSIPRCSSQDISPVLSLEKEDRFCNDTTTVHSRTNCVPCALNSHLSCPNGTKQLTTGPGSSDCTYIEAIGSHRAKLNGCRHRCERVLQVASCCPGYWGNQCEECVGGSSNPCFGRGICDDGYEGTGNCSCLEQLRGTACEFCIDSRMYGQNCTLECRCVNGTCNNGPEGDGSCDCFPGYTGALCETELPGCENVTCGEFSRCVEVGGNATCRCEEGYESGLSGCQAIDSCLSSPCDVNAVCESTGPAEFTCSCKAGFRGDGRFCLYINPCSVNNGDCVRNSSLCIDLGLGKHYCRCKFGYEVYRPGVGCSVTDMCVRTPDTCHQNARCETVKPGVAECQCRSGYVGDGKTCHGNILQQLSDMNGNYSGDPITRDSLQRVLTLLLSSQFSDLLSNHGPLTLFVPVDRGFKNILRTTSLSELRRNEDRIQQIIYQHLIVGQLTVASMQNSAIFYTLHGGSAELQAKRGSFRFKLHGRNDKTKILKQDIVASNGIIHIVNSLLTSQPDQMGNKSVNLCDLISSEGRHNRFVTLIRNAGMESWLNAPNVTVFAPSNSAWNVFPKGTLDYLQSKMGRDRLVSVIQQHIFSGRIAAGDLINVGRIKSMEGSYINVKVTNVGQILLNNEAWVSQTNIPARNGLYHHIESVLLPQGVNSLMPNRCSKVSHKVVKSDCKRCYQPMKCLKPGVLRVKTCMHPFKSRGWFQRDGVAARSSRLMQGCQFQCNSTTVEPQCCDGFFGKECSPCPQLFTQVCNGHGTCLDGITGDGSCLCNNGFTGVACQECENKIMFGANCSQECTCLYGNCDSGPLGSGKCKEGTCADGYAGENCDMKREECGRVVLDCHAHSVCVSDSVGSRCVCKPGYEGNGVYCREIDPCLGPHRGKCHPQALCTKTGPGMHQCRCEDGWAGDGSVECYRPSHCSGPYSAICQTNSQCRPISLGKYGCVCDKGYRKIQGRCQSTDPCEVNNGGCHAKANCTSEGTQATCTCSQGYEGDGKLCFSTIDVEIQQQSTLSGVANLFSKIPPEDNVFHDRNGSYTVFAPNNAAIEMFKKKASAEYWQEEENILTFQSYHTLQGSYTISDLGELTELMDKVNTLAPGLSANVSMNNQNEVFVNSAKVIDADIPTVNGIIHIIDKVLEPYPVNADPPTLTDFFMKHPEFSLFAGGLKNVGLLNKLEAMSEYSLFVLSNDDIQANDISNKTLYRVKFLSLFVVPKLLLSTSISPGQTVNTILGARDQIQFTRKRAGMYANGALMTTVDRLTAAGVVHQVNQVIRSSHRHCDLKIRNTTYGSCVSCGGFRRSVCPPGYPPPSDLLLHTKCTFFVPIGGRSYKTIGCQALCLKTRIVRSCCSGYYGEDCEECPGGAANPCSGRGLCKDSGVCQCEERFDGQACNKCQSGWTGNNCTTVKSCKTDNGGCHANADCSLKDGAVVCACRPGYDGDGVMFCEKLPVTCPFSNQTCSPDKHCSNESLAGDHSNYTLMCECLPNYSGNDTGIFCRNRGLMTAIKTIPITVQFYQALTDVNWALELGDVIQRLTDLQKNSTVFLPVDWGYVNGQLSTEDIKNHVVKGFAQVEAMWWYDADSTFVTEAGNTIVIRHKSGFTVSGVKVLKRNLRNANGLIHIIEKPLWFKGPTSRPPVSTNSPYSSPDSAVNRTQSSVTQYSPRAVTNTTTGTQTNVPVLDTDSPVTKEPPQDSFNVLPVAVGVGVTVLLLVVAIVISVWAWRARATGFLSLRKRFHGKGSERSPSMAQPLKDDEDDYDGLKPPATTKFSNPVFATKFSDEDL